MKRIALVLGLCTWGLAASAQDLPLWFEEPFVDNVNRWDDEQQNFPAMLVGKYNTFAFGEGKVQLRLRIDSRQAATDDQALMLWGTRKVALLFQISHRGFYALDLKNSFRADYTPNWQRLPKNTLKKDFNELELRREGQNLSAWLNGKKIMDLPLPADFNANEVLLLHSKHVGMEKFAIYRDAGSINVAESVKELKAERENLGPKVNSKGMEKRPFISPDGKTLYFLRERPNHLNNSIIQDIWFSTLDEKGQWTEARDIGSPINTESNNFLVSAMPDNNSLAVINTYSRDASGDQVIAITERQANGRWSNPQPRTIKNSLKQGRWLSLHLAPDGKTLVYATKRHDSYGGRDVYVCFLQPNGEFSEPKNLGPTINTPGNEHCPFLAADGKTLYFDTDGHPGYGGRDIFVARRLDDTWTNWSKPENMGPVFNSKDSDEGFVTSAQGDYAYVVSSRDALGELDIFRIKVPEALRPEPTVLLRGRLNCPNEGSIPLRIMEGEKEIALAQTDPETGEFQLSLPAGKRYRLESPHPLVTAQDLDLSGVTRYEVRNLAAQACEQAPAPPAPTPVQPSLAPEPVALPEVLFATASAQLLPQAKADLDELAKALKANPDLSLQAVGHTDYRNSLSYNQALSRQRVEAVCSYLEAQGIAAERLERSFEGETKPREQGLDTQSLARNRRVVFDAVSESVPVRQKASTTLYNE